MIVATTVAAGATMFVELSAADVARVILIVGVATPLVAFALMERPDVSGD